MKCYKEVIDFIASGPTPNEVISFRPSKAANQHIAQLIEKEKVGSLSEIEQSELKHFLELEQIMRLAKARAHRHMH